MAQLPSEQPDDNAEKPLPTPEDVEKLFDSDKRKVYEAAGEGRRRGLLKRWETEKRNAPASPPARGEVRPDTATGAAVREMLALGQSYLKTPSGDIPLRVRKIRYMADIQSASMNPFHKAQRALQCHILDAFITKDAVDYNDIARDVQSDPRCAHLDETMIKALYLAFIRVLLQDQQIMEEIFEDDDL